MWFKLGEYLQSTPRLHELRILTHLSAHPRTSQAELGRLVGLAPAMINTYLRRLSGEGLITQVALDGRGFEYRLTPQGERQRLYHVISFMADISTLFDEVLDDLRKRIQTACESEPCRLVLYGAGETGQMAYLALQGLPHITLVGVVDDDPQKIGTAFFEHEIRPPETVRKLQPNKVLVSSWGQMETMAARISSLTEGTGITVITLL